MSPLGDGVLRQSSLTRSPRPAFTLTDELFITAEESTGDPANFSMGLLAVLKLGPSNQRRRARTGRFEISLGVLLHIFMKWTRAPSERPLGDSLTYGEVDKTPCFPNRRVISGFSRTLNSRMWESAADPCRFIECTHAVRYA